MQIILGAADPEMSRIEQLAAACGLPVAYATHGGERVRSYNAYQADGPIPDTSPVWTVECAIQDVVPTVRIDHHRPGDAGYGKPPKHYLPASSIGQMLDHLARAGYRPLPEDTPARNGDRPGLRSTGTGWVLVQTYPDGTLYRSDIPADMLYTAAADHCLGAAYRGECPGVAPDDLRVWRTHTRARFQRISYTDLWERQEVAIRRLRQQPTMHIGQHAYKDARNASIPELPEAAAILGVAVIYRMRDPQYGEKEGLLNGSPKQVQAWMHANQDRLARIYGDPARGFAGGYVK